MLQAEFRASNPAWVVGLTLTPAGQFRALVEYPTVLEEDVPEGEELPIKSEYVDVPEVWVIKAYGQEMADAVQYLRDSTDALEYVTVPRIHARNQLLWIARYAKFDMFPNEPLNMLTRRNYKLRRRRS